MKTFEDTKKGLKEYLSFKSLYSPFVTSNSNMNIFPKVVVEMADDREIKTDTKRFNVISSKYIEINIYAQDKTVGTKKVSGRTIAREIETHIKNYMGEYLNFKRTLDTPTPNLDTTVYRITMRYQKNINEKFM